MTGFVLYLLFTSLTPMADPAAVEDSAPRETFLIRTLKKAFPGDEGVWQSPIRVHLLKSGLVFASGTIDFNPDGRVFLSDAALTWVSGDGKEPVARPTAARSASVVLTLDPPAKRISDMGKSRIVSIRLQGGLLVVPDR